MHYQWLFQAYIIYTLYRIPQKFKNFKFFQNFIKLKNLIFFFKNLTFQNFIKFQFFFFKIQKISKFSIFFQNFQKKIKIFIKYIYYQRHGWNIWYNEHYMSKSVSHAVSTLDLYHPSGRWPLGWYRVLGLIRHVIQILTCNIQYLLND